MTISLHRDYCTRHMRVQVLIDDKPFQRFIVNVYWGDTRIATKTSATNPRWAAWAAINETRCILMWPERHRGRRIAS